MFTIFEPYTNFVRSKVRLCECEERKDRMDPILIYCKEKNLQVEIRLIYISFTVPFSHQSGVRRTIVSSMKLTDRVNEAMTAGDLVL